MADPPTILIAEDQEGQRVLLDMLLSLEGYELHMVEDGREALEYLKDNTPNLTILDVNMPHVNGIEVCERMRKNSRLREVPVIILTVLKDEHTATMARLVKADALVVKPLGGKDFRGMVRELLDKDTAAD